MVDEMTKNWGGIRNGAGRPKGLNKYGESTKPVRIPLSRIDDVVQLLQNKTYKLPFYSSKVATDFPSPADDLADKRLDLNEFLIKNPLSTFFVRVSDLSMIKAGIYPDDILIVDRSLTPSHNKIVIVALDGDFTVKRLYKDINKILLMPENDDFKPIDITSHEGALVWGVVTNVIHAC